MPERRFLDPSTLTRAERLVGVSAWLGVVNAAIPWWYRAETSSGEVLSFNAGVDWTGTVAWVCFGIASVLVLVKAWIWPEPAPHKDGILYTLAGLVALGSLTVQSTSHESAAAGFYLALALAFGLTVGGTLRRRERHSGWR